jgi:hypothetical protein
MIKKNDNYLNIIFIFTINMNTKTCCKCQIEFPLDKFYNKDRYCIPCRTIYGKEKISCPSCNKIVARWSLSSHKKKCTREELCKGCTSSRCSTCNNNPLYKQTKVNCDLCNKLLIRWCIFSHTKICNTTIYENYLKNSLTKK